MITDVEGVIQYVNPAFEAQTGYDAEEALGRTPQILNSGAHDAAFFEELWETLLEGEVWEREVVNRRKDGTTIYVDQTIAPVFGEDGTIEHFVAVNHDITDRKEKELALERQNQRLEEFASVVSHDLRNPLTVARGHLEFLEETEHVAKLDAALDRMANIIEEVLTLAREGEVVEAVQPLDIGQLAMESWQVVDPPADRLEVAADIDPIAGDPERTRRILENLCRNAVEHGGEDVRVTVGGLPGGGFFFEDDGPGIDPGVREQVFESGYTTAASGTGLGLSIVSRLAEAQGWSVELTEGSAGGARFEFRPSDEPL
jgi:PAS domain S-box-containing protein